MIEITLPHGGWTPRPHQMPLWEYLRGGGKRAMAVWHRRAGKDDVCLHNAAVAATERVGNYWHCLPEYLQGRKAIWTAINPHTGIRRIDEAFPQAMRASTNDHEMFIRLLNGSTWQVIGSDNYDRTVGSSAAGVVFSEFALANPAAWAYMRPMLEENDGWAAFITTPRGRNHAFEMSKFAAIAEGWFYQLLTARDTGTMSAEALGEALNEYKALYGADVGEAQFRQEYLCDWQAAILGAFFSREMADVRREGRVTEEAIALPGVPVHRAWDLGIGNDTSIWWFQAVGAQLFVLDHLATSGVGLDWWAETIQQRAQQHGWTHGIDYVPHDAKVKELGTGRTRVETMKALHLNPELVPLATIADGINAVRRTLPLCVFHPRCEVGGLDALEQYAREWDDEKKAFRASAIANWTCHPADSFRYLSQSWRPAPITVSKAKPQAGWVIPPPREDHRRILSSMRESRHGR